MAQYGFRPRGRLNNSDFTVQKFIMGATQVAVGDMVKIVSGKVVASTTGGTANVGVVVGPGDLQTSMSALVVNTSTVRVITDADAVYASDDASARTIGTNLDMTGTTGIMALTTDTNDDFVIIADSSSTQETLVTLATSAHFQTSAQ